ncbi:hypothetical protein ACFFRR_002218 [Megaselia abdita]
MVHILYKCRDCRAKAAARIPAKDSKDHDDDNNLWYFFDMCEKCKDTIKEGYESCRNWVYEPAAPNTSDASNNITILSLNEYIFCEIFKYLTVSDLKNVSLTCKSLLRQSESALVNNTHLKWDRMRCEDLKEIPYFYRKIKNLDMDDISRISEQQISKLTVLNNPEKSDKNFENLRILVKFDDRNQNRFASDKLVPILSKFENLKNLQIDLEILCINQNIPLPRFVKVFTENRLNRRPLKEYVNSVTIENCSVEKNFTGILRLFQTIKELNVVNCQLNTSSETLHLHNLRSLSLTKVFRPMCKIVFRKLQKLQFAQSWLIKLPEYVAANRGTLQELSIQIMGENNEGIFKNIDLKKVKLKVLKISCHYEMVDSLLEEQTELEELELRRTVITSGLFECLSTFRKLRKLSLFDLANKYGAFVIPKDCALVFRDLRVFNYDYSFQSGASYMSLAVMEFAIKHLEAIEKLDIKFVDNIAKPKVIRILPNLTELTLSGKFMTLVFPTSVIMPKLVKFQTDNTEFKAKDCFDIVDCILRIMKFDEKEKKEQQKSDAETDQIIQICS